jgi:membrane protease YdiL (CAAX protease family)
MAISCLSPIVVTISTLYFSNDALVTLLALHVISYVGIPYLYIKYLSKEGELKVYFMNEFQDRMYQIKAGISLFASAFGLVVIAYIILFEFRHKLLMILQIPIKFNFFYILFFFFFYGVVNPVLEEWFWRIFVPKTYTDSDRNKGLLSFVYTLFHYIIIGYMMDWKYAIGVTSTFYSIG